MRREENVAMVQTGSYAAPAARVIALHVAAFPLRSISASADTRLELTNDFIEALKNRATIEGTFTPKFDHSKPKKPSPNNPSNDGDIHISGTAPEIGLFTVTKIMNAADFPNTLQHVEDKRGGGCSWWGIRPHVKAEFPPTAMSLREVMRRLCPARSAEVVKSNETVGIGNL
jgi:hypothetical protein